MKIIFITAKPSFMPDSEDLGTWQLLPNADGFFMQTLDDYLLFAHECLSDYSSEPYNVTLKVEKKHAIVASWLETVLSFVQKKWGEISKDDIFLIVHDKDLVDHHDTCECVYREKRIQEVKGGLENKVKDGHVYIFQHVHAQDMCEALINDLIEPSVENVEQALLVINKYTNET